MQTQLPYITSLLESGRYPLLTRVFDAPLDPDRLKHGFDLGLERVLDGLAQMLPDSSVADECPYDKEGRSASAVASRHSTG